MLKITLFVLCSIAPTCSEGKEEALVRVFLQQGPDSLAHPLISLVDEFLSEVAVYLLGCHLLTGWQGHIVEIRDLQLQKWWFEWSQNGEYKNK